jgi:membrane protease subunit HflC
MTSHAVFTKDPSMHLLFSDAPSGTSSSMRAWRWLAVVLPILVMAATGLRTVFFVDESEYVFVTQFGEPVRFCSLPGLEVKWPHQSLRRFDRRLQVFEPPAREMLTEDKENLNFAWYVCWRLPGPTGAVGSDRAAASLEQHVRRFLEAVGTVEVAENRLEERVQSALAAEIGRTRLSQLISLQPQDVQLQAIGQRVISTLREPIADQFGIEVIDIRLKRFTYPEAVKPAVFAEIRSERERVAVQYRAQGASEKAKIQSLADLQRDQLLAEAKRQALTIRGAGDAKAIEVFNEAHAADPKFYELLKTLETYRSMLDDQTTVVLSADSPLLKLLSQGLPEGDKRQAPDLRPQAPDLRPPSSDDRPPINPNSTPDR